MRKYIVTITKFDTQTEKVKEYEKLLDSDALSKMQMKNPEAKQYGYVETEREVEEEIVIYKQAIEGEIDLKSIIDAVNKK